MTASSNINSSFLEPSEEFSDGRLRVAIFRYIRSVACLKVMEENSEAEKAAKLAGVTYWAKDMNMMRDSCQKPAECSVINLYQTNFLMWIENTADREHSG